MRYLVALVVLGVALGSITAAAEGDDVKPGTQQAKTLKTSIPVEMDYLLYLPKDYDAKENWPLLLFLHGAGERGDDLNQVKEHGPPKLVEQGKDMPFIVVSPQCPKGSWWQPTTLMGLIDDVAKNYKVDQDRIYVTGLSMGGFGTWTLAAYAPDRLAAIVPICGGGEPRRADVIKHLPIWVFHGAKDNAVPLAKSEEMVEALRRAGAEVKFTVYPEAGHDSWTEAYNTPELYDWLLAQKRTAKE